MKKNNKQNKKVHREGPSFDSDGLDIYDHSIKKIIQIMPDTLDNKLRDFENSIKNKGNLFNELGLIVAFLATLLTVSEFKDFLEISGNIWRALFLLFLLCSILKFCKSFYYYFKKSTTRKGIIKNLLNKEKIK